MSTASSDYGDLGVAIAELLVQHGKLDRDKAELYSRDGKVKVSRVRVTADYVLFSQSL